MRGPEGKIPWGKKVTGLVLQIFPVQAQGLLLLIYVTGGWSEDQFSLLLTLDCPLGTKEQEDRMDTACISPALPISLHMSKGRNMTA